MNKSMRNFNQDDFNKIESLWGFAQDFNFEKHGMKKGSITQEVEEWLEDLRANFHVK